MKSTKRSLLLSTLSLIMCVAMLLGTTYAWFTDSVTSGRNKIVAGNLDVELYHGKTLPIAQIEANSVKDATELFGVSLWEPGVVAYENFTVANVGNLALKYALNLNVFDKNATTAGNDLTEVIKVAVVDGGFTGNRAEAQAITGFQTLADFQKTGNLAAKNDGDTDETTYGIVLYWQPTDNDNLYNLKNGLASNDGQPLFVEFGVNLVATQDTVESDSFDKLYDLSANLPVIASFPAIKKADLTTDKSVKIEEKGAVKSAEVPAKGATSVFNELKKDETTYSNDLTLTLNVNETANKEKAVEGGTEKTVDFDINMSAVMTSTNISTNEVTTEKKEKVEAFSEFVTIEMNIGFGYTSVLAKHKGVNMQELSSADATPTDAVNGGYYYDAGSGILTLKTKTFSPFSLELERVNYCLVFGTNSLDFEGTLDDTIEYLKTNGHQHIYLTGYLKLEKDIVLPTYSNTTTQINAWGVCTIDLNGHTISQATQNVNGACATLLNAYSYPDYGYPECVLNIIDTSTSQTGRINAPYRAIQTETQGSGKVTVNIYSGTFETACPLQNCAEDNVASTVFVRGNSTLNLYNGTIKCSKTHEKYTAGGISTVDLDEGDYWAIGVEDAGSIVNIYGGTVDTPWRGTIGGTVNIYDGTINGTIPQSAQVIDHRN